MFVWKKDIELHWHTLGISPHWALYLFCIAPCAGFHMTNTISTARNGGGSKHHAVGVFLSGRTLSSSWVKDERSQMQSVTGLNVELTFIAFIVQRKHTQEGERHQMKCMRLTQRTLANWEQLKKKMLRKNNIKKRWKRNRTYKIKQEMILPNHWIIISFIAYRDTNEELFQSAETWA